MRIFFLSFLLQVALVATAQDRTLTIHQADGTVTSLTASALDSIIFEPAPVVHEYVDLGLPSGTLWATCNVGAATEADPGEYYAWGEVQTKTGYLSDWSDYLWFDSDQKLITKYCADQTYGIYDGILFLQPEDDAASVLWGAEWKTPTYEEFMELSNRATWTYEQRTTSDGKTIQGAKVTGPNNNSIFLPAAGYFAARQLYLLSGLGLYWCADLSNANAAFASYWGFTPQGGSKPAINQEWGLTSRAIGQPVRPVRKALRTLPANPKNVLNIHQTSGSVVTYAFSEHPVLTYSGTVLVITTNQVKVEYPVADIVKLDFGGQSSDIETVSVRASQGDLRIFNLKGQLLHTVPADAEKGTADIFDKLPAGVYVVKNGSETSKIQKL